ncbi:hypothetical protein MNBD_GAMMA22-2374 [hydrothermal vent metagenome]|uniref:Uncharacterized protein n=1 Tax=hydrothermal vent metagenome TaxID=652676 RepID=A0A3B0ZVM5_9ZZZZ
MIFRRLSLLFFFALTSSPALAAGEDTLKSLFMFQQKMAESGITSAMMKMGKMYEKGEGVEKSNANALKMYQQAQAAGDAKAADNIKRLTNAKSKPTKSVQKNRQQQAQAVARATALKAAKDKAQREKLKLKQQRAKAKARQLKATKIKAAKIKAKRDAKLRAEKSKAYRKIRAAKKAKAAKLARAVNNVIPTSDYEEDEENIVAAKTKATPADAPEKGFKSDPCKSKAARLLSICR